MKKCAVLGASGHGKVIAEIADLNGYSVSFFDDKWPIEKKLEKWAVIGNFQSLLPIAPQFDLTVVAIGDNHIRCEKYNLLNSAGAKFGVLAHPKSYVSESAIIEEGSVIMANSSICAFSKIGKSCIINTGATIDHDCFIQDFVHISPGANLAGEVKVGAFSWIGIGSQVKQQIKIGKSSIVAAGSTVIQEINDFKMVCGNPAKEKKDLT